MQNLGQMDGEKRPPSASSTPNAARHGAAVSPFVQPHITTLNVADRLSRMGRSEPERALTHTHIAPPPLTLRMSSLLNVGSEASQQGRQASDATQGDLVVLELLELLARFDGVLRDDHARVFVLLPPSFASLILVYRHR